MDDRPCKDLSLDGNEMGISPRSLLAFGELSRNGGKTRSGAAWRLACLIGRITLGCRSWHWPGCCTTRQ